MRRILCGVVVGLAILASGARSAPPPAAPPDPNPANPLQGNWLVVDYESSGKKLKSATGTTWEIQGQRIVRKAKTGTAFTYQIKLDTTKNPMEIDLTPVTATSTGTAKTLKGICQIQGDQLKIIYGSGIKGAEKPRPTFFGTNVGDGYLMYTLQKQK